MKRIFALMLALLMLTGCGSQTVTEVTETTSPAAPAQAQSAMVSAGEDIAFTSRFDSSTTITLSDDGIRVEGNEAAVSLSNDIIYYEDKDAYDSGNPYGEGEAGERHSAEEAASHTVVNITEPGAYTVSGTLSAGQIRVDLGDDAYEDPEAVVELTLKDADITCTVAPAILFLNTYECDGEWSTETATADVDTGAAGANLILEGENKVSGSHVAKIFKDKEEEKKLWKQDGAVYSYMSMNVWGPGALELTADNEGLDTELHLTINGGDISIYADNDGINTNEDGVSVTTINGGSLHIVAGLGAEGDGIDSNGYLVINGGIVVSSANPAADAGLDSDMGSYIHGGTVIALGSTMDWAESDSRQVTMNLQFAGYQSSGSAIIVTDENETPVFAYDPSEDEVLGSNVRRYQGAIISCAGFTQGATYHIYTGGTITGQETGGVYTSVSAYEGSVQMQYTGTDMRGGMGGGRGGMMGQRGEGGMPEGFEPGEMGEGMTIPEGFEPGGMGEGMTLPEGMEPGQMPENFTLPEGETMPADFDPGSFGGRGQRGDGEEMTPPEGVDGEMPTMPEGEAMAEGQRPDRGTNGGMTAQTGEASTEFYMSDMVNAFSGITAVMGE